LQTRQQPFEEALRCLGVSPGLNQDVEHNAILIDGTPEVMLHALDTDEDFIHVPLVARSWPAASQAVGETGGELLAPPPNRLAGDDDATFSQGQLNITQTEAEHLIQPDSVADDLGRKPMTVMRVGWWHHVPVSPNSFDPANPDYRDNARQTAQIFDHSGFAKLDSAHLDGAYSKNSSWPRSR
jgi:hypothetical protein